MKQKNTSLSFLFKYLKPYTGLILVAMVFLIASQIAATIEPVFLRNIINGITLHQSYSLILSILVIYFAVRFGAVLMDFLRDYVFAPAIMGIACDVEVSVFDHLLKLPVSYHADQQSGSATRALTRGSNAVSFMLDFTVSQLLPPVFQLIFVTALLLRLYNWYYGIITLITVLVYAIFTIWTTDKRQKYRIEGNIQDDAAAGVFSDAITNVETVKYFGNESIMLHKFIGFKADWFKLFVRNNRLFALIASGQSTILFIGLGLILVLAVRQAAAGQISVGDLVLLSTYVIQLAAPVAVLGFVYGNLKNTLADLTSMAKIMENDITLAEPKHPIEIPKPKGEIEFNHVEFDYPTRKDIINDLNLTVLPGQKIAFVGASGGGKSTITKLLFRLYDVTKGSIKIDGIDIKELSAKSRRKIIGIVPQEPAMFNATITENIKFGKPDATHEEVVAAAKSANLHDFIESLPQKYNTYVGERGVKISGGEKQRIAIARAIIKDPKIIVFDEATSSLDSKTEQAILKTLDSVAQGRTTIAIAHRLSTVIDSDVIYVLAHGKIVEHGTHAELLKHNGTYANLWQIQARTHK